MRNLIVMVSKPRSGGRVKPLVRLGEPGVRMRFFQSPERATEKLLNGNEFWNMPPVPG
jgi:hypothetical protein